MKNKKNYAFGLPALLLMGGVFGFHQTTSPSGVFYQNTATGTLVEIAEDGTETVISTTTQSGRSKEVAAIFDLQDKISSAIDKAFEVESVVTIMDDQTETQVQVLVLSDDSSSIQTESIENIVLDYHGKRIYFSPIIMRSRTPVLSAA